MGESVAQPMLYWTHNVVGAVNLIEAMRKHGVKNVSPQNCCPLHSVHARPDCQIWLLSVCQRDSPHRTACHCIRPNTRFVSQ